MPYSGGGGIGGPRRRRKRAAAPYDPGKRRAAEGKQQPNRGRPSRPAPVAPKPDVTLGGDKTPNRSGHARARTRSTPRPDVTLGGDRNTRTGHQTSSRRERRRKAKARQQRALMRYTRSKLSGFKEPMRDRDTKILGVNVEAELEGRGVLPKIGKKIGDAIAPTAGKALRANGIPISDKTAENAVRDSVDLAANLPSGLYLTGAAAKEAIGGDTKRAKKLFRDYKKTSAIPALVSGHPGEALKRANEHPVSTALELQGAKALVGRGAGATMRRGVFGKAAKRRASVERNPLELYPKDLPGDGPKEARRYSKDQITKERELYQERRARKQGRDPDVDAGQAAAAGVAVRRPSLNRRREQLGIEQKGGPPRRSRLMRRLDTRIFSGERVRKGRIQRAVRDTSKLAPHPSKTRYPLAARKGAVSREASPLVHLVAEGTVTGLKTARAELKARLRHLERSQKRAAKRHPVFARGNVGEAAVIRDLLKLDDAELTRVFAAADEFAKQEGSRQARAHAAGQYSVEEQSARWMPYLQSHHHLKGAELREAALKLEQGAERLKVGNKIIRRPKREPAFVTQRPVKLNAAGKDAGAYQPPVRGNSATAPPGGSRSGVAYDLGAREVGAEALARQAILSEGRATSGEIGQALANEFGVQAGKDGRFFAETHNEAELRGRTLTEDPVTGELLPGHHRLIPFNVDGLQRNYKAKLQKIQQNILPDRSESDVFGEALAEALSKESGKGRWILLPEDVVQRLSEHANVRTSDLAGVTNVFKDVVLTTSSPTTWLTGNISDLGFRSIMAGITPNEIVRGRMVIRQAESKGLQGEMAAAAVARGGLFHTSHGAERFSPARVDEHVARTIAAAPWRAWKGLVYTLEESIEHLPQYGAVGKAATKGELGPKLTRRKLTPEDEGMKKSLQRLLFATDEQVDNWAATLAGDHAVEARIQGLVEDVVGRWGKVSPRMRKVLATAPFIQWLGAALRYTYVTLPVKHPIKTAIAAGLMQMTSEERKRLGLSYMIPQDQRAQDYQMGVLPMHVGMGKHGLEVSGLATGNLTSFGTAGNFPQNVPGFFLPQLRGAFSALGFGVSFTGEKMEYPDWWPDKAVRGMPLSREDTGLVALGSLLEAGVPFASAFRRSVLEKGRTSAPDSTILTPRTRKRWDAEHKQWRESEGSLFGGIMEWLNPLSTRNVLTHKDVENIREGQETGAVFGRMRDKSDAKIRRQGGQDAVKVNRQLRTIRNKMQALPQDSPERYKLYLLNRHLSQRLANLTDGKSGHDYKTAPKTPEEYANPYGKHGGTNPYGGDTSGNPYVDSSEANPYVDSNESNPYSSGSGSNPYAP